MTLPKSVKRQYIIPLLIVLFAALGWFIYSTLKKPVLPKNVTNNVSFVIYYPAKPWQIEQKTATYSPNAKVLTFHAQSSDINILLNEQSTPDQFSDIPEYYNTLLGKLNSYQTLSTAVGTVNLTHPQELNGGQSAVFNASGTLVFAQPNKTLSSDDWQRFFNALYTLRP